MIGINFLTKLERSHDTVFVDWSDGVLVMSFKTGRYFGMRGTGPRIWELLEYPIQPEAIVDAILAEFDVDELTGREETLTYLRELMDAGLVLPVTG